MGGGPADPRVIDHLRTRRQAWKAPCRAWTSPPLPAEATATSCSPRTSLPCVSTPCESKGGYGSAYQAMGTGSGNAMEYLLATLNLNGYKTETEEEEEEEPTTPAPPSPFDGSYVDAHLKKIDEYTALQNDYKTDRLTVKVNWDLQDSKYEYLKNQHGIYPQVKAIHRPGPYGSSYGRVPYGGGGYVTNLPMVMNHQSTTMVMVTNHQPM